jgi:polyisoprenoid-binding protein YceI
MERYAFKVTGSLNRKDYGLTWNAALEAGGVAVSETVRLDINIEITKAK